MFGDVPALMPQAQSAQKFNPDGTAHPPGSWFAIADSKNRGAQSDGRKVPGFRFDGSGRSFQTASVEAHVEGQKTSGGIPHVRDGAPHMKPPARVSANPPAEGRKGAGAEWFDQNTSSLPSASPRRKAASAKIAKIPFALSSWIARCYLPKADAA